MQDPTIEMLPDIGPDGQPVYRAAEPAEATLRPPAPRLSYNPWPLFLLIAAGAFLLAVSRLRKPPVMSGRRQNLAKTVHGISLESHGNVTGIFKNTPISHWNVI